MLYGAAYDCKIFSRKRFPRKRDHKLSLRNVIAPKMYLARHLHLLIYDSHFLSDTKAGVYHNTDGLRRTHYDIYRCEFSAQLCRI